MIYPAGLCSNARQVNPSSNIFTPTPRRTPARGGLRKPYKLPGIFPILPCCPDIEGFNVLNALLYVATGVDDGVHVVSGALAVFFGGATVGSCTRVGGGGVNWGWVSGLAKAREAGEAEVLEYSRQWILRTLRGWHQRRISCLSLSPYFSTFYSSPYYLCMWSPQLRRSMP
ncbi:hypothetical protein BGX38DRAFT_1171881 [Terfezia claveryi]|nr:hypothetical protein BGX38DRAFT_1171881 [Terfezia claveryi]